MLTCVSLSSGVSSCCSVVSLSESDRLGEEGGSGGGGASWGECCADRDRGPEEEGRVGEEEGVSRSVNSVHVVGARSASILSTCRAGLSL